jgi:hypothetical protein
MKYKHHMTKLHIKWGRVITVIDWYLNEKEDFRLEVIMLNLRQYTLASINLKSK